MTPETAGLILKEWESKLQINEDHLDKNIFPISDGKILEHLIYQSVTVQCILCSLLVKGFSMIKVCRLI